MAVRAQPLMLAFLVVCACRPESRPPAVVPPPPAAPGQERQALNRCYPGGRPPVPSAPPMLGPDDDTFYYCEPVLERDLIDVEAEVRRRYRPHSRPSRVYVSFDCDPFMGPADFDLEQAEEGKSLFLASFSERSGELVALRGVAGSLQVGRKTFQRAEFDAAWVRLTLTARIREVTLDGFMPNNSGQSGNRRIHRRLGAFADGTDANGQRALELRYTGLNASLIGTDSVLIPLEMASERMTKLVDRLDFADGTTLDEATKQLFARRFRVARRTREPWLRELFLGMAGWAASTRIVPELIDVAEHGTPLERSLAIVALVTATGWDARMDPQGRPRELAAVTADYARECSR